MNDIVFPAINAKTIAQLEIEKAKIDNKRMLVEYPEGSHVMFRLQTKGGPLAPLYEGPYTAIKKNQGNAYVLRYHTGVLMPRNYTSTELKLISQDEVIAVDDEGNEIKSFEIEAILDHRDTPTKREYLVRWKNQSRDFDEWIAQSEFNATESLRNYWKKLGTPYKPKKSELLEIAPTTSQTLKKNPPDSISQLMNSFVAEEADTSPVVTTPKRSCKRRKVNPNKPSRRSKRRSTNTNKN